MNGSIKVFCSYKAASKISTAEQALLEGSDHQTTKLLFMFNCFSLFTLLILSVVWVGEVQTWGPLAAISEVVIHSTTVLKDNCGGWLAVRANQ